MLDAELIRQMRADGLHAIALRRMVAGCDIGDTRLTREVGRRLGDLAAQVHIGASRDRRIEIALGAAGAPGDAAYRAVMLADHERRTPQRVLDLGDKTLETH